MRRSFNLSLRLKNRQYFMSEHFVKMSYYLLKRRLRSLENFSGKSRLNGLLGSAILFNYSYLYEQQRCYYNKVESNEYAQEDVNYKNMRCLQLGIINNGSNNEQLHFTCNSNHYDNNKNNCSRGDSIIHKNNNQIEMNSQNNFHKGNFYNDSHEYIKRNSVINNTVNSATTTNNITTNTHLSQTHSVTANDISGQVNSCVVDLIELENKVVYPHRVLRYLILHNNFTEAATYYELHYNASTQSFLSFCNYCTCEVRDTIILLMRLYTTLGNMSRVRDVFRIALRDLHYRRNCNNNNNDKSEMKCTNVRLHEHMSLSESSSDNNNFKGKADAEEESNAISEPDILEITTELEREARALKVQLPRSKEKIESDNKVHTNNDTATEQDNNINNNNNNNNDNNNHSNKSDKLIDEEKYNSSWRDEKNDNGHNYFSESLLNVNIFNTYLEILTMRKNYDVEEVLMVLSQMDTAHVVPNALTYHYLIELHIRAGYDPECLWSEMIDEQKLIPTPATVQTLLLRVLPFCNDAHFAVQIVQAGLRCGPRILDKKLIKEIIERWLREKSFANKDHVATSANNSSSSSNKSMKTGKNSNIHSYKTRSYHNNSKTETSTSEESASPEAPQQQQEQQEEESEEEEQLRQLKTNNMENSDETNSSSVYTQSLLSFTNSYPPSYVLWLLLELEVRCVLERASFTQYVDKHLLLELLVKCAKVADVHSAEATRALMDRHAMSQTAEIMAMMVWCYAASKQLEDAFDLLEVMARRGFVDHLDAFSKYVVAPIHYVMERNFLSLLVDAIDTPAEMQRCISHLHTRQQTLLSSCNKNNNSNNSNSNSNNNNKFQSVSIHSLDLIVLAACKMGEERDALKLVAAYYPCWRLHPRVNTYNSLLMGTLSQRGTLLHRLIYDTMLHSGVLPNAQSYRVLIRQAVLSDNVDAALFYLKEVTRRQSLRVEVEMILPIIERAAKAGDVTLVEQMSQFALDADIGLDPTLLERVIEMLTNAGQSVSVIKAHQSLHEALRSRSRIGRLRARSEVVLV